MPKIETIETSLKCRMLVCPLPRVQRLVWIPIAVDCAYFVAILTFGFGSMALRRLINGGLRQNLWVMGDRIGD
jgi:hypothetical protein